MPKDRLVCWDCPQVNLPTCGSCSEHTHITDHEPVNREKVRTPYIYKNEDGSVDIIGESRGLEALGTLLVQKAQLGGNLSATFSDGVNPHIRILSAEDLPGVDRTLLPQLFGRVMNWEAENGILSLIVLEEDAPAIGKKVYRVIELLPGGNYRQRIVPAPPTEEEG